MLATSKMPGESYEQYASDMSSYLRKQGPARLRRARDDAALTGRARTCGTANEKALSFSYAFLGVRLQCAECHKHPFDQWSQEDFKHFTAFFNRVSFGVPRKTKPAKKKMVESLGLKDLKANELRKAVRQTGRRRQAGADPRAVHHHGRRDHRGQRQGQETHRLDRA